MANMTQWFKEYGISIALGAVAIGGIAYGGHALNEVQEVKTDIQKLQTEKETRLGKAADAKSYSKKKHTTVIEARTVSAQHIAKDIIAVDDTLTQFYKRNTALSGTKAEQAAFFKKVEAMKKQNTKLTGATEADQIKTWKLNPEWKTTLATVLTYQDSDRVPVLFDMKTGKGEDAGVVYAIYDTRNDKLENVSKHYTNVGTLDAVQVGGM